MKESVPTTSMMVKWAEIINSKAIPTHKSMLVADSYYLDETSHYHLLELDISFMYAVQTCCFEELVKLVASIVKKPDKSAILMNEASGETFIHYWYKESSLGKNMCLLMSSNVLLAILLRPLF
jgi:hypothetical protein